MHEGKRLLQEGQLRQARKAPARPTEGGWALEISLDVETTHAVCPNCQILLVEAERRRSQTSQPPRKRGAACGATEISNSWGGPSPTRRQLGLQPPRHRDRGATGDYGS